MIAVSRTLSVVTLFAPPGIRHLVETATAPSRILMRVDPCGKPQRGTHQLFSIENQDRLHSFRPQAVGIPLFEYVSGLSGPIVFV